MASNESEMVGYLPWITSFSRATFQQLNTSRVFQPRVFKLAGANKVLFETLVPFFFLFLRLVDLT